MLHHTVLRPLGLIQISGGAGHYYPRCVSAGNTGNTTLQLFNGYSVLKQDYQIYRRHSFLAYLVGEKVLSLIGVRCHHKMEGECSLKN